MRGVICRVRLNETARATDSSLSVLADSLRSMAMDQLALEAPPGTKSRFRRWWHRHDHNLDHQHLKFSLIRSFAIMLVVIGPLVSIATLNPAARWLCFAVGVPVFMNRVVYHSLVAPFGTYDEKIRNRVSSYGYLFFVALLVVQRSLDAPTVVLQACLVLITVTAAVNFLSDLKEFAPLWAKSGDTFSEAKVVLPADQSDFSSLLRDGAYVALHRVDSCSPGEVRRIKYTFKPIVAEPIVSFLSTAAICFGYNTLTAPFADKPGQSFATMAPLFACSLVAVLLFPWQRKVAQKFNAELSRVRTVAPPASESLLGYSKRGVLTMAKILFGGALIMWEIILLAWLVYPAPFGESTQICLVLMMAILSALALTMLLIGTRNRAASRKFVRDVWRLVKSKVWIAREPATERTVLRTLEGEVS